MKELKIIIYSVNPMSKKVTYNRFFLKARWNWYKLKKDYFMLALKICNEDLIPNISPKRFVLGKKVVWATEWPGLDVVNHQPMNKWSMQTCLVCRILIHLGIFVKKRKPISTDKQWGSVRMTEMSVSHVSYMTSSAAAKRKQLAFMSLWSRVAHLQCFTCRLWVPADVCIHDPTQDVYLDFSS